MWRIIGEYTASPLMCVCLCNRKTTNQAHKLIASHFVYPSPIPSPQNPRLLPPPPLPVFSKCRYGNETGCLIHEVNIFPVAGTTWVLMHSSVSAKTRQSIVSRSHTMILPESEGGSQSTGLSKQRSALDRAILSLLSDGKTRKFKLIISFLYINVHHKEEIFQ